MNESPLSLMNKRQKALKKREKLIKDLEIDQISIKSHKTTTEKKAKTVRVVRDTPYPFRHTTKIEDEFKSKIVLGNPIEKEPEFLDGVHELKQIDVEDSNTTEEQIKELLRSKSVKTTLNETNLFQWMESSYGFGVRKVVGNRILSITMCPSMRDIVTVVGDVKGEVGFWFLDPSKGIEDYSSEGNTFHFRVHTSGVTRIQNLYNTLYTSSFDGSMKKFDFEKGITDDVFRVDPQIRRSTSICDFVSIHKDAPLFFVALNHGSVCFFDERERQIQGSSTSFTLHDRKINTIDYSPDRHLLLTASLDRTMKLWDLRMTSNKPKTITKPLYSYTSLQSNNSAYFSSTENLIVLTSLDNTIRVFDVQKLVEYSTQSKRKKTPKIEEKSLYTEIKHDNTTGRWLSKFLPHFCPLTQDFLDHKTHNEYFLSGSMRQPRSIDLYEYVFEDPKPLIYNYTLQHPLLGSVFSVLDVHPYYPVIAGGNSSGRVCIYVKH